MRVFEIDTDPDDYQEIACDRYEFDTLYATQTVGNPISHIWRQPQNPYIANPMASVPDFYSLDGPPLFVVEANGRAEDLVGDVLKSAAEILPLKMDKKAMHAFNILAVNECIDYERSVLSYAGEPNTLPNAYAIEKYVFIINRMPENSIFRLPRLGGPSVFAYEGVKENPEEEFKYLYDKHNLTGLEFRLVWDSEADEA